MIYLKTFNNHSAYEANKDSLLESCVVSDGEHVHYFSKDSNPCLVLFNSDLTKVLYSKTLYNGYSNDIVITLDNIGGTELQLNSPLVFYQDGCNFGFSVTTPTSSTDSTTYTLSTIGVCTIQEVTLEMVDTYPLVSSYLGKQVCVGEQVIKPTLSDINTELD